MKRGPMRTALPILAFVLIGGCGTTSAPPQVQPKVEAPRRVMDHTPALIQDHLIASRVVPDHILDQPKLPGGSFGEYENKGRKYQSFIVDAATDQAAAMMLFDFKAVLKDPEYISYMGGYFGSDGKQPVYVFAKLHYIAGITGLPKDQADALARTLASRIH